jgi:hypothetical protein
MSMQAMLTPVFALIALTFILLFWMSVLRINAIRHGQVNPQAISLREPNWPPRATQISNAFHNQLETPLLFYVVTLLSLITNTADSILWVLSWMFVLARIAHAYVHVTSNRIDRRGPLFLIGAVGLCLMWIIVAARIILASSA